MEQWPRVPLVHKGVQSLKRTKNHHTWWNVLSDGVMYSGCVLNVNVSDQIWIQVSFRLISTLKILSYKVGDRPGSHSKTRSKRFLKTTGQMESIEDRRGWPILNFHIADLKELESFENHIRQTPLGSFFLLRILLKAKQISVFHCVSL